ncbi:hypothetical protein M569_12393 [Genlisea aurea]|uniref:DUF538 domain-containing protein n=1 Tax=Genlisea aurea TaxID=192259 RepID=S8CD83_9LAMI|nr:hypothetical protein M569_12393 [Genlisea aurea]
MAAISFLCLLISLLTVISAPTADALTAYEVLQSYDFPVGLLPKGVTGYELNSGTGKFTLHLNQTCTFKIQGYDLRYQKTITGTISKDRISIQSGIQVKILFWFNIVRVTRIDDQLEFSVGLLSADFPVDSFYESPQCGCGFDCVNLFRGFSSD